MTETARSDVISRDGTQLAVFARGSGPPLLLVHGGAGDHNRWDALRPHLEPHATVHTMDRRGRGASGDTDGYALEREFEDVAAVVDAIARAEGAVDVYGHSYGGICAFGAVALTGNIRRLALYEGWPPVDPDLLTGPPDIIERVEALLAAQQEEAALETVLREVVQMTDDEVAVFRAHPSWPSRVATVPTFPREERAFAANRFTTEAAARVTVPTLLLVGSDSPHWAAQAAPVAAAMPDARIVVLEGQTHVADVLAPELVAGQLLPFLDRESASRQ